MKTHSFIMSPSIWLGEGRISLNMVEDELVFYTKWSVADKDTSGNIECVQEIQVKGLSEVMFNQFFLSNLSPKAFLIELENQSLGKIIGNGVIDDKVIAWEFRTPDLGFEGFEVYEKQHDEEYLLHAEYSTSDQFRTIIKGRVWKQNPQLQK